MTYCMVVYMLQKKSTGIIIGSDYCEPTNRLFIILLQQHVLKCYDFVHVNAAVTPYKSKKLFFKLYSGIVWRSVISWINYYSLFCPYKIRFSYVAYCNAFDEGYTNVIKLFYVFLWNTVSPSNPNYNVTWGKMKQCHFCG